MKAFGELFIDETKKGIKLQTSEYKKQGNHIIVDQGKNPIAGYTDREKGLFEDVPVIIFGDHTRVIKYVDQPFFLGADGVKILRSKDKNSNYKYLYYALRNANIPDTGYNRHFKWLKETKINYPSVAMQDEIVKILDKLSDIIDRRKTQLQGLDNLIKARFVEMFGDTRKNPYNYMKLTVAEAIEAGYIEKPFDGNHGGKHPKSSEYVECGTPFLMANNIVDGKVDLVNCSFVTEERANKLDKGFARDNDVLITHKGTIGRTAVLRTDYDFVMLTPQVASYRVKDGLTSDYLCGYFNTDYFQNDMKTLASAGGSTRAYAGITAQLQLKLIIPPIDLQNQFVAFVHQVDKSKLLSLIKLLEQLITYLYNVFIIYRQDKGEEVERHE